jgi:hypothetical protein
MRHARNRLGRRLSDPRRETSDLSTHPAPIAPARSWSLSRRPSRAALAPIGDSPGRGRVRAPGPSRSLTCRIADHQECPWLALGRVLGLGTSIRTSQVAPIDPERFQGLSLAGRWAVDPGIGPEPREWNPARPGRSAVARTLGT